MRKVELGSGGWCWRKCLPLFFNGERARPAGRRQVVDTEQSRDEEIQRSVLKGLVSSGHKHSSPSHRVQSTPVQSCTAGLSDEVALHHESASPSPVYLQARSQHDHNYIHLRGNPCKHCKFLQSAVSTVEATNQVCLFVFYLFAQIQTKTVNKYN